jgi:hypothetical protein
VPFPDVATYLGNLSRNLHAGNEGRFAFHLILSRCRSHNRNDWDATLRCPDGDVHHVALLIRIEVSSEMSAVGSC